MTGGRFPDFPPSHLGARFVFDAGPLARLYVPDVSTANLQAIYAAAPGDVLAPSMAAGEITSAWLAAVREGQISWEEYAALRVQFEADVASSRVRLLADDDLLQDVLEVKDENTRQHLENPQVPVLHSHDAYYVALARIWVEEGERAILVTADARVWKATQALGLEVFHARTCDLGRAQPHIGNPGQDFPQGRHCTPCSDVTCPSGFTVDLTTLPLNLNSATPT